MQPRDADRIFNALAKSPFRRRFRLTGRERATLEAKGLAVILEHARDFIDKRLAPANPPITSPLPSERTFLALALMTVWPRLTWPSPATTTLPPLRTVRMVVPCQTSGDAA